METTYRQNAKHLTVDISQSISVALEKLSSSLGVSISQALSRILEGLPGLAPSELNTFEEPPRERRSSVSFNVSTRALTALDDSSLRSSLSRSSICRRILYGLLVTQEIGFVGYADNHGLLRRTQLILLFPEEGQVPPVDSASCRADFQTRVRRRYD
jgi:hypothetical protein